LESAQETLRHEGIGDTADLALVITSDRRIRELNRVYRGFDSTTDVLSFSADHTDPDTGLVFLGDIVISLPQAEAQARTAGHSLEDEVRLLVVHGILHLLDHDHESPEEKERMWSAQAEILARLGASPDLPE
jgi:probable rRNA maturation factor